MLNLKRKECIVIVKPEITYLSISYSGGIEIEGNYSYSVFKDSDKYRLQATLNSGRSEVEKKISRKDYEAFVRLFDDVDIASWDNSDDTYNGMGLLDAARFCFSVSFSDGTEFSAESFVNAPDGFSEAVDAFKALFKQRIGKENAFRH